MIQYSTLDRCYVVTCGNASRYVDTMSEAMDILAILKFGEKLKKLLK